MQKKRKNHNGWRKRRPCLNVPQLKPSAEMREQVEERWEKTELPRHLAQAKELKRLRTSRREETMTVGDMQSDHELKYSVLPCDLGAAWFPEEMYLMLKTLSAQVKRKSKMASGALIMKVQPKDMAAQDAMIVRLSGYKEYNARGGLQVARDAMARFEMRLRKKPKLESGIHDDVMYLKTKFGSVMVAYCPQVTYNLREERQLVMLVLARVISEMLDGDEVVWNSATRIINICMDEMGKKAERALTMVAKVLAAVKVQPMDMAQYRQCEKILREWPEALIWQEWREGFGQPRILFQEIEPEQMAI